MRTRLLQRPGWPPWNVSATRRSPTRRLPPLRAQTRSPPWPMPPPESTAWTPTCVACGLQRRPPRRTRGPRATARARSRALQLPRLARGARSNARTAASLTSCMTRCARLRLKGLAVAMGMGCSAIRSEGLFFWRGRSLSLLGRKHVFFLAWCAYITRKKMWGQPERRDWWAGKKTHAEKRTSRGTKRQRDST